MPSPRPSRRIPPPGLSPALLLLACGLFLFLVAGLHPALAAPTDDEITEAVAVVLSDGRFQTELPNDARPAEAVSAPGSRWRFDLPDGLTGLARLLMWVLVAAGGVLLAIFVINEISSFRLRPRGSAQRPDAGAATAGLEGGEAVHRTSLEAADQLARDGRYAEALHMLLLDCIAQLRRLRFDSLIAPSLTSREVASRLSLPEQSAEALSAIVSAVELSHFGGRVPGEGDYASCRESYFRVAGDSVGAA